MNSFFKTTLFFSVLLCIGLAKESAEETFSKATHLAETNLTQARELYRLSAALFEKQAETDPIHRGSHLYNAGNAYFLSGSRGQAIIAYRRAEILIPGSKFLQDNLNFVRKQSGNNTQETDSTTLYSKVFFWLQNSAFQWTLLFIMTLLLWIEVFSRQWKGKGVPFLPLKPILTVTLLLATLVIYHEIQERRLDRAVILSPQVEARKGPNYGYLPAFSAPLDSGIECQIITTQDDWIQIKIDDDRTAWVPQSTLARIR